MRHDSYNTFLSNKIISLGGHVTLKSCQAIKLCNRLTLLSLSIGGAMISAISARGCLPCDLLTALAFQKSHYRYCIASELAFWHHRSVSFYWWCISFLFSWPRTGNSSSLKKVVQVKTDRLDYNGERVCNYSRPHATWKTMWCIKQLSEIDDRLWLLSALVAFFKISLM